MSAATALGADSSSVSLVSTAPSVESLYTPSASDQETDEFELVDAWGTDDSQWDSSSTCSTSLHPSVYDDEIVHGRRYHGYNRGRYPLPNDQLERQREETFHAMMLELTEGHLFYADIGDHPQKIIDIGTGTGTWAIDVADLYPSASVIGTDLSAIQPTWLPVNARMFVEDCEEAEWLHGSGFDLVHFRSMANVVHDLDGILSKAYPHIKNGGWVEFQEFIPRIACDDGSMTEDDPLCLFADLALYGMRELGCSPIETGDLEKAMERAGLTNIQCVKKKVPISSWARDRRLQTVGTFMKEVVEGAVEAYSAKPLAVLDISQAERRGLVAHVKKSLDDRAIHRYINVCFCFGQKREEDPAPAVERS